MCGCTRIKVFKRRSMDKWLQTVSSRCIVI